MAEFNVPAAADILNPSVSHAPCGRGGCARARADVGGARAPPDAISASLPRCPSRELEEEVGPRVRGQSEGSDPADRCTWVGAGAKKAIAPAPGVPRARNGR